jgi:hypothetical protein
MSSISELEQRLMYTENVTEKLSLLKEYLKINYEAAIGALMVMPGSREMDIGEKQRAFMCKKILELLS